MNFFFYWDCENQATNLINCFKEIIKVFSYILLLAQLKTAGRAQGSASLQLEGLVPSQGMLFGVGSLYWGPARPCG